MTLSDFFDKNSKCALGYSGGVDSAFLLYAAVRHNVDIKPYFVKSSFTTDKECEAALVFAASLGCKAEIIDVDVLLHENIVSNDADRCYHCKKLIFNAIFERANYDGYDVVIEGTNASDDILDRPGFLAITELGVLSPLKLCGITKDEIRLQLKEAGIKLWNKPATACLATRIPTGIKITEKDLYRVSKCEEILFDIGFSDFRVRIFYNAARIQLKNEYFALASEKHRKIYEAFKTYFDDVFLDFKER